jgi:hypothetical protein
VIVFLLDQICFGTATQVTVKKLEPFGGKCIIVQCVFSKPANIKVIFTLNGEVHYGKQPLGQLKGSNEPADFAE